MEFSVRVQLPISPQLMEIKSQFDFRNKTFRVTYRDGVPSESSDNVFLGGVHSFCFYGDKLVVVRHGEDNNWTPPGGAIQNRF